ncbi:MAG: 50S ribosomal protein L28 [Candidatus Omnitrophica bacterium]|nr:50S ribosomal protein L28 [Candidatus Omnitrophota bacterium]
MAKICELCGKGIVVGGTLTRKGKPKREGGIGQHISDRNKRRFLPNLQPARVLVNGRIKKIKVCTKCIKKGRLIRATRLPAAAA